MDLNEDIKRLKFALAAIETGKIYADDLETKMPNVYSPKPLIDRAEAELMIAEVMRYHGFDNIRCKWKRPKSIIIPT